MPSDARPPHRAVELTLRIGANDDRALADALRTFETQLARSELSGSGVSGGPSFGWIYDIQRDPDMTPERYREELREYLEKRKDAE